MYRKQTMNLGKFARRFCTQKSKDVKKIDADYIGPPDPVSNLRPIVFHQPQNETRIEKKFRETREETQNWNQNFWIKHNTSFMQERKEYRETLVSQGNENPTADEMSTFYKKFLDKNWKTHAKYNITWYKKNIHLLLLEFRVRISKFKIK